MLISRTPCRRTCSGLKGLDRLTSVISLTSICSIACPSPLRTSTASALPPHSFLAAGLPSPTFSDIFAFGLILDRALRDEGQLWEGQAVGHHHLAPTCLSYKAPLDTILFANAAVEQSRPLLMHLRHCRLRHSELCPVATVEATVLREEDGAGLALQRCRIRDECGVIFCRERRGVRSAQQVEVAGWCGGELPLDLSLQPLHVRTVTRGPPRRASGEGPVACVRRVTRGVTLRTDRDRACRFSKMFFL